MADIKISELGAASAVNATDSFPMTSSGVTLKATAQQIKNYMGVGNLTDLSTDNKTNLVAAINEVDEHADTAQVTANNAQQMIAPILSSLVAPSGGLESGDQFIYNGLLYKATAAIAQGGTITIGDNCTLADSVTEQIVNLSGIVNQKENVIRFDASGNTVKDFMTAILNRIINEAPVGSNAIYGVWTGHSYYCGTYYKPTRTVVTFFVNMSQTIYTCDYSENIQLLVSQTNMTIL